MLIFARFIKKLPFVDTFRTLNWKKIESEIGSLDKLLPMTPEKIEAKEGWDALRRIKQKVMKSFMDHRNDREILWEFNLKTAEWKIMS